MIRIILRLLFCCLALVLAASGPTVRAVPIPKADHAAAAKKALERYRFEEALKHLQAALKADPKNAELQLLAAQTARRKGALEEAEKYLKEAERLKADAKAIQIERWMFQMQAGALGEAESRLWELVQKEHPQKALILEAMGVAFVTNESRPGAGLHCFKKLLEIDKTNLIALHGRAWLFERMSNFPEAEADLRRILELDPKDDRAKIRLAGVLYATSRSDDALKLYDELIPARKDDPQVILGRARCKQELGQGEEAARILDEYLAKVPEIWDRKLSRKKATPAESSWVEALTDRGKIAIEAGDIKLAEKCLRRAVELGPFDRQANHALYICLNNLGKDKEARELLPKLRQIEADIARLMEIFHTEMDQKPRDARLHHQIGAILLRNGQEQTALYWLKRGLKFDPKHRPTHQALADYYQKTGDKKRAEEHRKLAEQK